MADDTQEPGYSGEERVFTAGGEHYGIMYDVYRYVSLTLVSDGGAIFDLTQQVAQVSAVANAARDSAADAQQTANQGVDAAAAAQQTANDAKSLQTTPQAANVVYSGPATGANAVPMFRALVAADLPIIPVTKGGTGAADAPTARTNLGAASSGANSDITSIAGLTTALTVAQGGTGVKTLANYGVLIGNGANPIGAIAPGVAGTVFMSNGTGSYGSWQAIPNQPGRLINVQVFTASGTYTATAGTTSVIVEIQAAGSASGGAPATGASQCSAGGPGAAGGFIKHRMTSGFNGAAVVVGAAGLPGAAGTAGGAGGNSSFAGITANGASGGAVSGPAAAVAANAVGGSATGGNIENVQGSSSNPSFAGVAAALNIANIGANSRLGSGGGGGSVATGKGSGGGGTINGASAAATTGQAGTAGQVTVYEYA